MYDAFVRPCFLAVNNSRCLCTMRYNLRILHVSVPVNYGVNAISGTMVVDHTLALRCVSEGANFRQIKPTRLLYRAHSSGELGDSIKEQALILETSSGLLIITGCAHPGIVNVVRKAKELFKVEVYLVMGGFHLAGMSNAGIRETIRMLKEIGVKKVAPSHCTGERAIAFFREAWGDDFLEGGVGAGIELAQ